MWLLGRKKKAAAQPAGPAGAAGAATARATDPVLEARVDRTIRKYLAAYHPQGPAAAAKLGAAENLWREVTSLTMLQLVAYIEETFAFRVAPIDFAPQNFASIAAITRFVATRAHR